MLAPRCPKVLEVFAMCVCVFPSRLWNASASLGVPSPTPQHRAFYMKTNVAVFF